jgi:hypothetical protein
MTHENSKSGDTKSMPNSYESKINWLENKHFSLLHELSHISRKLRNIGGLKERLAIEAPDVSMEEIIHRLRKRKEDLIAKISMDKETSLKLLNTWNSPPYRSANFRVLRKYPNIAPDQYASFFDPSTIFGDRECNLTEGSTRFYSYEPYAWDHYGLQHNSTASYAVDYGSYLQNGSLIFHAELNDDAAALRNDSPDTKEWGSEITWSLPETNCDITAVCRIGIQLITNFTNGADDGGELVHAVAFAHSDIDGNLPEEIILGGIYDVLCYCDESQNIDSGHSEWIIAFDLNAGAEGKIALGLMTRLKALDGLVTSLGQWYVSRYISYQFVPRG